ncbi:MAG: ABC transporter permease subunit [Kiritimatiellae bacterium]|nr:ABC transporter permease subunit [Kiritimatiellia bacterium]
MMIPTGIGIITVFFIFSEIVPGGPLDQVESLIMDEARKAAESGASFGGANSQAGAMMAIDPQIRLQIKRKLGLNHNALERYLRMLLWFSPDSMISSQEIGNREARKVSFRGQKLMVYREDDAYHVYENSLSIDDRDGEVSFDAETQLFISTLDPSLRFSPESGQQVDGTGALTKVPAKVETESFDEVSYSESGVRIPIKEEREEVYPVQTAWEAFTDWDNWHGYFLLKFPNSITKNKKSYELIAERLPVSMRLGIISFFLTYTSCLLLGIAKAVRNGTRFDTVTSLLVLIGYGIPGFVLAVLLITMFGPSGDAVVHLFPLRGLHSPPEIYNALGPMAKLWDNIHHLIAPIICLTIGSFAGLTMLTKNSVLEQFDQLYAVAARARGLSQRRVLFKHILRNSLIPLVTGFPARFVMMFFAGSLLIEKIFSLDGIGLLGYTALVERDYPLMVSNLFVFTYIGLICRLLSDIGYVVVDPRISFEEHRS